jgi:FAD/FMN-containing dehydrogenase/Fe-S oxidoreductase
MPSDVVDVASGARGLRGLRERVQGEVRFDAGSRALYATDASNYRQTPIGVVLPRTAGDVIETVAFCREHELPLLPRGGGTSLAGQCCNTAVVLDSSKYMTSLLELDVQSATARVQPGIVLDVLRTAAQKHELTFAPDPATHAYCTLGGMIGNNSCGVHSVMAGKTEENVLELDILTYDGARMRVGATSEAEFVRIVSEGGRQAEIYRALRSLAERYAGLIRARYPRIPRRVSGFNLDQLLPENGFHVARALVGSEGTCVTVLEATLRLVDYPRARALVVAAFDTVHSAADAVPRIIEFGPIGLEGIDDVLLGDIRKKSLHASTMQLLGDAGGMLLVEFGGHTRAEASDRAQALSAHLDRAAHTLRVKVFDDPGEQRQIWEVRESGLGATAHVPGEGDSWPGWEDSAVPPERLGAYLDALRALLNKHGYTGAMYGHFGQGCVHSRITFDLATAPGIANFRAFLSAAADLVVEMGGSLSGEHGDGQARAEFLPKMFGPELVTAFREFKSIWDPLGRMNPGKVVDPFRADENLRIGTSYNPPPVDSQFHYTDNVSGGFARATLRCVGVGKCRRTDTGTMCPSHMATREERHSTRGRARLLFEMLEGETLTDGWRDEHVKEALDLCLACKACRRECPVNVDMATYKAEFLSHYYAGRVRPRHAYAFGLIGRWARLGGAAPRIANLLTQAPGLRTVSKLIAGVAPARTIPAFAQQTFRAWFAQRSRGTAPSPGGGSNMSVLLWPDTFNNHFHPETARAAVSVLEAAGCKVELPPRVLCCGRPLYDYGMVDTARRWLGHILRALRPQIAAGVPLVGLEPSCVAVFRDELTNLFPYDVDARRLADRTYLLSEFLAHHAPRFSPRPRRERAIVHLHCHHRSVLSVEDEVTLLERSGLDYEILDSGCCGMAGAFGFEREHHDISLRIGERVLLPAVRNAAPETLVIANGFSCREQVAQCTGRRAVHIADVLAEEIT